MSQLFLLIGGNGFVGYNVLKKLVESNKKVRCVNRTLPEQDAQIEGVEYRIGDVQERPFFEEALDGVNTVLDFASTTMPNTKEFSLENEINSTLRYHNYILSTMIDVGVKRYVFPSSGGAVYGSRKAEAAVETDILFPSTPYGAGKRITEDIIQYYNQKCGLSAAVLRIGNVYGSGRLRKRPQGVIDVFIQNALEGKPITIWGSASSAVRDYVHLEDVANAVDMIIDAELSGVNTYNIGTGIGTSVAQIVEMIEETLQCKVIREYKADSASGIDCIILSNEKIKSEIGWLPQINLAEGIKKTVALKKAIFCETIM